MNDKSIIRENSDVTKKRSNGLFLEPTTHVVWHPPQQIDLEQQAQNQHRSSMADHWKLWTPPSSCLADKNTVTFYLCLGFNKNIELGILVTACLFGSKRMLSGMLHKL